MESINFFVLQWRRSANLISSKVSILILLLFSCVSFIFESLSIKGKEIHTVFSAARMWSINGLANNDYKFFCGLFFICGIPIISVLFFSDEILLVKNNHISQFLFTRISRKKYYYITLLVAFLRSFCGMFVSLSINQILWIICCPLYSDVPISNTVTSDFDGSSHLVFINLFFDHPYLHNILYIFLISIFSALIALTSASLCFILKKQLQVLFFPLVIYFSENFLSASVGYYRYSISETLSPVPAVKHASINTYFIFIFILIVISGVCIKYGITKNKDEFE